jgi:hypothetical protein
MIEKVWELLPLRSLYRDPPQRCDKLGIFAFADYEYPCLVNKQLGDENRNQVDTFPMQGHRRLIGRG